ncbi:hypothetical protein NKK48_30205 [Mesorhizobium sp. C386A]|uniref:hypothetical protein n=1 Tax=unclassified Mesorhizobium TaxID=325217 RepID=UPI0012EC8D3F|nr:hypothetical protein [Mesorhizobium sp. LNJC386A00]
MSAIAPMEQNDECRKFNVTVVETIVHNFVVEVYEGERPADAAEDAFVNADKITDLENYTLIVRDRDVEDAQPV